MKLTTIKKTETRLGQLSLLLQDVGKTDYDKKKTTETRLRFRCRSKDQGSAPMLGFREAKPPHRRRFITIFKSFWMPLLAVRFTQDTEKTSFIWVLF